jgi:hypothetical protein
MTSCSIPVVLTGMISIWSDKCLFVTTEEQREVKLTYNEWMLLTIQQCIGLSPTKQNVHVETEKLLHIQGQWC